MGLRRPARDEKRLGSPRRAGSSWPYSGWFTLITIAARSVTLEFPNSPDPAQRFERMLSFFHAGDAKNDPIYGVYRRDQLLSSHQIRPVKRTDCAGAEQGQKPPLSQRRGVRAGVHGAEQPRDHASRRFAYLSSRRKAHRQLCLDGVHSPLSLSVRLSASIEAGTALLVRGTAVGLEIVILSNAGGRRARDAPGGWL
jgi:hypothetical protein